MSKLNHLNKKQLALLNDLFEGGLDEQELLEKHKININTYHNWLAMPCFIAEFDRRIDWLNRKSQALIAKYASLAAAKLIGLTESDKQETARKACLDIISLPKLNQNQTANPQENNNSQAPPTLSTQTATKLLAALANENI